MSLVLYFHPLASYCQKVLIALYEKGIPFEADLIDLGSEKDRARFGAVWPLLKFPVLRDTSRELTIPESTIIMEHLNVAFPRTPRLIPEGADEARECRLMDRLLDCYVEGPLQKIVTDDLRPEGERDSLGVAQAQTLLRSAYDILDGRLRGRTWAAGEHFSMADCSAAPALFYSQHVLKFAPEHAALAAYYKRLFARPSFVRVVEEAKPYFHNFPKKDG